MYKFITKKYEDEDVKKKEIFIKILKKEHKLYMNNTNIFIKEIIKEEINSSKHQLRFYFKDDGEIGGKAWCENHIYIIRGRI